MPRMLAVIVVGMALGLLGMLLALYAVPRGRRSVNVAVALSLLVGLAGGLYGGHWLSGLIAMCQSFVLSILLGEPLQSGLELPEARWWRGDDQGRREERVRELVQIGEAVNMLPAGDRPWCSMLGLRVRLDVAGEGATLRVGDGLATRVEARREGEGGKWVVETYIGGEWEGLVGPTMELAEWLAERGGVSVGMRNTLWEAIEGFRRRGVLDLSALEGR